MIGLANVFFGIHPAAIAGRLHPFRLIASSSSRYISLSRRLQYTSLAILCLFALRMGAGWHFFKEGSKKLKNPTFTSKYFLAAAKGPLAGTFLGMIPDRYGVERLNQKSTVAGWKKYKTSIESKLKLDKAGKERSAKIFKKRQQQLSEWFSIYGGDVDKHKLEVKRLKKAGTEEISDVQFRQQWMITKESELQRAPGKWLKEIDSIGKSLEADLLALGDPKLAAKAPRLVEYKKTMVDHAVTWTTLGVGVLLLLGLFTRPAALVGAGFLCSVLLTQPFWAYGSELGYAYYQFVEVLALLALAATGAGRFFGLDFFTEAIWARRARRKLETSEDGGLL